MTINLVFKYFIMPCTFFNRFILRRQKIVKFTFVDQY